MSGTRLEEPVILICCEGRQTEPIYLRQLCRHLRLRTVELQGGLCSPGAAVQEARRLRREREESHDWIPERDQVWCVLDVEAEATNLGFRPAAEEARRLGMKLAVSNLAFEYWFLLHFAFTTRPFADADELIRELRQHVPDYQKSGDLFLQLVPQMDTALANAHRARGLVSDSRTAYPNPSTTVDLLVATLRSCAPALTQPR